MLCRMPSFLPYLTSLQSRVPLISFWAWVIFPFWMPPFLFTPWSTQTCLLQEAFPECPAKSNLLLHLDSESSVCLGHILVFITSHQGAVVITSLAHGITSQKVRALAWKWPSLTSLCVHPRVQHWPYTWVVLMGYLLISKVTSDHHWAVLWCSFHLVLFSFLALGGGSMPASQCELVGTKGKPTHRLPVIFQGSCLHQIFKSWLTRWHLKRTHWRPNQLESRWQNSQAKLGYEVTVTGNIHL